ncbi:hypothetical protein [Sorangium sp. So ce385]|uniref:hypothetical protein n=1 Tax=Sorangium sp. So ce385 TaxID=3133308 RepID=UPI003F5C7375
MDKEDAARLESMEIAAALFNGIGYLQMLVWRCFAARHEANMIDGLVRLESALLKTIEMRALGSMQGGPQHVTHEDVERLQRLTVLVSQWRAGEELSPEIEPLARQLFVIVGGNASDLPAGSDADPP